MPTIYTTKNPGMTENTAVGVAVPHEGWVPSPEGAITSTTNSGAKVTSLEWKRASEGDLDNSRLIVERTWRPANAKLGRPEQVSVVAKLILNVVVNNGVDAPYILGEQETQCFLSFPGPKIPEGALLGLAQQLNTTYGAMICLDATLVPEGEVDGTTIDSLSRGLLFYKAVTTFVQPS